MDLVFISKKRLPLCPWKP